MMFLASRPAQRVFKIKLQFPSAGLCNEAGQGVLRERIKLAIAKLNQGEKLYFYYYFRQIIGKFVTKFNLDIV